MRVSELYNRHINETLYIVGTGPSLRVFPKSFFSDKLTIGLNQVWRTIPQKYLTYLITIHPETLPTNIEKTKIVTKRKGNLTGQEPYYFFTNNKDVKDFSFCTSREDKLYVGRGIHTAAMTLAAKMKVRWVILVGCDMGSLNDQHHATSQATQFHGIDPKEVYKEYYYNACQLRKFLCNKFAIDFLSITPFFGNYLEEDFERLLKEKGMEPLPQVNDVSTYKRKQLDFIS